MRQFIQWLLLTAIVSLTQTQKIEYIRTSIQPIVPRIVKPVVRCYGESLWHIDNYAAEGNTIQLRFQSRMNDNCECKNYLRIRSRCLFYEVVIDTVHSEDSCPDYQVTDISQVASFLEGCTSAEILAKQQLIMFDIANTVPGNGNYCLQNNNKSLVLSGWVFQHIFGPKRIWLQ